VASGRSVIVAFAVAATAFVMTHLLPVPGSVHQLMAATGGQPIFDMQPSFSVDETYARLATFGETGRAMYSRTLITTDVIFPVCVVAFLFLLGRYTATKLAAPPLTRALLMGLPLAYFALDLIENASIFALLSSYPERNELIASCLPYLTTAKRIAQAASILLPTALYLTRAARQ
jgi:hypothetical protein